MQTHPRRNAAWPIIPFLAIAQIAVTGLPALGIGRSIGARSAEAPTLLTPPGWAFAIWATIYLATIAFAVWQALPRNQAREPFIRIGWWAAAALACNTLWPLVYQAQGSRGASVAIIFAEFACLIVAVRRIGRPGWRDPDQYLVALPLGLLGGWVMAASILNMAGWLGNVAQVPLPSFAPEVWVAMLAVAGGLLAALTVSRSGNAWFALAFLWALGGIGARAAGDGNRMGLLATLIGAAVLAGAAALRLIRDNRRKEPF